MIFSLTILFCGHKMAKCCLCKMCVQFEKKKMLKCKVFSILSLKLLIFEAFNIDIVLLKNLVNTLKLKALIPLYCLTMKLMCTCFVMILIYNFCSQ